MMQRSNGFTLIEVLIALIILAIAFTAVIETSSSSIRNSDRVADRLAAHWVAMNVMSEIQSRFLPSPDNNAGTQGSMPMMQKTWQWQANLEKDGQASYKRIAVDVFLNGKRQQPLVGFIRKW